MSEFLPLQCAVRVLNCSSTMHSIDRGAGTELTEEYLMFLDQVCSLGPFQDSLLIYH